MAGYWELIEKSNAEGFCQKYLSSGFNEQRKGKRAFILVEDLVNSDKSLPFAVLHKSLSFNVQAAISTGPDSIAYAVAYHGSSSSKKVVLEL